VTGELASQPFSQNIVQLTQAEHIELRWNGNYWKRQHEHLKEQNEELKQALELTHAKIRDLEQRSEMSRLKIKSAAFVGKRMVCWRRQRTQGLLRSRLKPMFA
jgi:hypothetical protein